MTEQDSIDLKKLRIIQEIVKRHPAYGTEKGYSWYTGGMKDSGAWYFEHMLEQPLADLQQFYSDIVAEEAKPKQEMTEEEIRDSKIVYMDPESGSWITKHALNIMADLKQKSEERLLKGDQ